MALVQTRSPMPPVVADDLVWAVVTGARATTIRSPPVSLFSHVKREAPTAATPSDEVSDATSGCRRSRLGGGDRRPSHNHQIPPSLFFPM
ncbi:hypothetical protein CDL15_Pgr027891 [Punica granatum]|uniref:Uncharacterized protein n=1 Tax=Punica granatum TaxID=22663 RepID=A0A218XJL6_PUNGR|nr:hypothetical protein CDL15_Pgr027891 [Punica granatum]